ncbi:MAG: family 10 glycosylhydrolase [Cytophagaceae bacterium]|nr:family 10 glycosylhydrolase [Cytophagaceae bacterium]
MILIILQLSILSGLLPDGHKIYNFGLPQVREYITQLIVNVVRHYDIDGIHFDDYFYPYPVAGQVLDDNESFKTYNRGISDLGDWRRDNVQYFGQTDFGCSKF